MTGPDQGEPSVSERASTGRPDNPPHRVTTFALALALIVLPAFTYYLWACLEFNAGLPMWPTRSLLDRLPPPTWQAVLIIAGWLAFQGLLQLVAPGRQARGARLPDGTSLTYRLNAWSAWWITWAAVTVGIALGWFRSTDLADQFGALLTTANLFAFFISLALYFGRRAIAAPHESTEGGLRDFWFGVALNPRIGTFDLKFFCEGRPGLFAWVLMDFSLAAKQYDLHGVLTQPMILVCAFQFWYVADYCFHEELILSTWDIRHEKFGWMLCWGDLVWVPFTYTVQAYYLVGHTHDLPWWGAAAIVLLNVVGYIVFRGANLQKHRFRDDSTQPVWRRPADYIRTTRGSLLLASGWWGLARHINYFGDLLMGLAWCLPCLFGSPLPYSHLVFLTILLIQRERRDNARCADRYGEDWDSYCRKVPYRIVPGLY
ncbi:DUF1295 domain-containing protein [Bradyrhizobium diazoefficiens]|uniref:DUF1295 domain-containing protein n=1 Tax=Bradyrhizobium diazoefficiens TaxID=1355477 RepID=UPI00359820DA